MSEIKREREEAFLKELNELIKRHGLVVRGKQNDSFIYDIYYSKTGSDVVFDSFITDEYKFVNNEAVEPFKPFWKHLMRGNL
jgi:hypothetical protein